MIFKICWEVDKNDVDFERKLISFENIISAHRDRNHVVYCNRKIARKILNSNLLSLSGKKALLEINESSREYKEASKEISVVSHIIFDKEDYIGNVKTEKQTVIEISYDYFMCNLRTRPSTLIPENDSDFELFNIIGESYLKSCSNHHFGIKFEKNCGYGSHTFKVYSDYKSQNRFALCIVDSDSKYPGAPLGSTARPFLNLGFSVENTVEAKLLTVREAESLLPDDVIESALVEGNYSAGMVDILEKVKKLDQDSKGIFRQYFDHKDGISLKQALQPKLVGFWKPHFAQERTLPVKPCYKSNICDDCGSCIKLEGFGERILENSLNTMARSNKRNLITRLSGGIKEEWESIGVKMLAWGCIPSPRRARVS
ncbi:hypothetical protein DFX34_RS14260 [Vibrio parahaemolyticus]|nr:hypothetical protein [Vibrio parahaemolyticus]EJG0303302.1 hypothetical protein [Vibrio parahaemolyticus]EJG0515074.1 hypothetical protein [Vibrio parahaemolyticus]